MVFHRGQFHGDIFICENGPFITIYYFFFVFSVLLVHCVA